MDKKSYLCGMTLEEDREREKSRREALGKFLYNLAQTCFTAMVVGAVVTYFMANVKTSTFLSLFIVGLVTTIAIAYVANYILKK